jgi:hypothetical protein
VFFEQIEEVTREVKEINKKHLKVHVMVEAEKQVKQDYMRQLVKKQRELMMQFGEDPGDDITDTIEPEALDIKMDTQSTKLMEDIKKK